MSFLRGALCFLIISMSTTLLAKKDRRTKIDFEDQLVEGINKQPLDSLSQLSEDRASKKYRLYRKRAGFRDLHDNFLDELRNLQ
jgi:hypothetical protein